MRVELSHENARPFLKLLFICGLACVIGPRRTLSFFFQRHKLKASAAFLGGVLVVLMGWPIVGMILETYGFVLLFRSLSLLTDLIGPIPFLCQLFLTVHYLSIISYRQLFVNYFVPSIIYQLF